MSDINLNDFAPYYPKSWKPSTAYESTLYVLCELNTSDQDYKYVESLFDRKVIKIYRVQHPIAFLRYNVHTEFLENEGITFQERLGYFPISRNEVDVCLTYNCDNRLVSGRPEITYTPTNLYTDYVIIVMHRTSETNTDKNHYPLYAVEFDY